MTAEVWLRNPDNYIKEAIEVGHSNLAWDWGVLRKKSIDPFAFCNLYFGEQPWRAMIMRSDGTALLDNTHNYDNPKAVWPTWEYGQHWETLEKMVYAPWGDDIKKCTSEYTPAELRPSYGQEHRIIIARPPASNTGIGKKFYRTLSQFQGENPDVILHLHGLYSWRIMFGHEFLSVDIDGRTDAAKDRIFLPSGKIVTQASATQQPHWVELLGMRPVDLKIPRNRCMFNIKSAVWAAEHFKDAVRFKTKGFQHIDPDDPSGRPPKNNVIMVKRQKPSPGDKWLCNTCNLQLACKFYREGAVCIVPESEPKELARFFKTRDSSTIIEGLGTLLAASSTRLNKAIKSEEENDELYPETRKMIKDLFDQGTKLAKLVDPALAAAGSAKVTTNNLTQINAANPQELMAAVMDEFVKKGIPRSQVTPEMVMRVLEQPEDVQQHAIDVAAEEAFGD